MLDSWMPCSSIGLTPCERPCSADLSGLLLVVCVRLIAPVGQLSKHHRSLSTLLLRRLRTLLLLSLISSLSLSTIPLAQTQHSRLAHIGIAYEKAFQILRLDKCRNLHMVLVLHAVFRLRLSIRCADNYR
jgi:hypothetical protein